MLSALTALNCRGGDIGLTKEHELLSRFADRGRGWSSLQQGTYRSRHRCKHYVDGEFVGRRLCICAV
jgi:hypothetical protein